MAKHTPTPLLIASGSPIKGYTEVYFLAATGQNEETIAEIKTEYVNDMVRAVNCHELLLSALKEARCQLHGNLGDLVDHFEIKHTKGVLDTINEAISKAESEG